MEHRHWVRKRTDVFESDRALRGYRSAVVKKAEIVANPPEYGRIHQLWSGEASTTDDDITERAGAGICESDTKEW